MTSEPERTKDEISRELLQREDVRNALAAEGDLPEGARGGMEQAQMNQGSGRAELVPREEAEGARSEDASADAGAGAS